MTTDLATRGNDALALAHNVFGEDRIAVLKEQLGRGWKEPMTDAELGHIALVCQRTRLDPLAKPAQIYFIKRWDARAGKEIMTPQVSIDGLRLVAHRSREYAGQVGPEWTADGEKWQSVWLSDEPPAAARVGVLRKCFKDPIWSVATWREWAQYMDEYKGSQKTGNKVLAPFWASKGAHMLAKTAEGMSLKRSFPEETNELELARVDEELRAQMAFNVEMHKRIFGADETDYERIQQGLPRPQVALNAGGDVVNVPTGEVLIEHESQEPAPLTPEAKRARIAELKAEAKKRGLTADVQAFAADPGEDPLDVAIVYWEHRIENHDLDQAAQRESEKLL